jgi:anti-sigma B factor antagonist
MLLKERTLNGATVIDVFGTLNATHPQRLKDLVSKVVRRGEKHIVLNLRGLEHSDSAGLGELVACYTRATDSDATIALADAKPRIRELLAVTNLLTIFNVFDCEADAIRSFAVAA